MSVVGIVSMKGGVGKTSVTANLAAALGSRLEAGRVCAIDLDPQNGLHWHLGLVAQAMPGVCQATVQGENWIDSFVPSEFNVACLPYGRVTEAEREEFETILSQSDGWIGEQLDEAGLSRNAVVVIDTPPGPSVYLKQVFSCADLILVVLLADAGSYTTIPEMETWLADFAAARPELKVFYVLNQVNRHEKLNRDTTAFLHKHLKPRISPMDIHSHEKIAEALAFQQPVISYDPNGTGSKDFNRLAAWVVDVLTE